MLQSRLKSVGNQGGLQTVIFLAAVEDVTTEAKLLNLDGATVYADITARNAATPSSGDVCYVTAEKKNFRYDGSAWEEVNDQTIYDSHTFTGTDGFVRIEVADMDDLGLTMSGPEEVDSTGSEGELNFRVSGFDPENLAFAKSGSFGKFIAIAKDNNGRQIQIGTIDNPASLQVADDNGTKGKPTQSPGIGYKIKSNGWPRFYAGAVTIQS